MADPRLKQKLAAGQFIVAPGVFDMISTMLAERVGFDAVYASGYWLTASYLGLPDAGIATYTEMLSRVAKVVEKSTAPVIADADTGFGGLLNVHHTVRGYERAGVTAIQIEDQEFPKKCGHMLGRSVIPAQDMADKIRVAVETRHDPNFQIIARTDARTTLGLDEALRRAEVYARAGADVLFVESPESIEEMERIAKHFDLPLVANMVEGGRTPVLSFEQLEAIGYGLAIFPATAFLAAGAAMQSVYQTLLTDKSSTHVTQPLYDFQAFSTLMGFDWVSQFDQQFKTTDT